MPSEKPYRIRVRVVDEKPLKYNEIRKRLVPYVDCVDAKDGIEFVICADKEKHLKVVSEKLESAGLEEIHGPTDVNKPPAARRSSVGRRIHQEPHQNRSEGRENRSQETSGPSLSKKPYGFVPLPEQFTTTPPVWHDGSGSKGRLSGEVRCELTTLTPLLVGWERRRIDDGDEPWPVPHKQVVGSDIDSFIKRAASQVHPDARDSGKQHKVERARQEYIEQMRGKVIDVTIDGAGYTISSKSVLCPLRTPWGERPVLLPGDSIKGLLRHELGALFGAPMERVAERSYSYRPNSLFPNRPNPRLVPRLARVPHDGTVLRHLDTNDASSPKVRVPIRLELLPEDLRYDRDHQRRPPRYRFDANDGAPYRGGLGAGMRLNSKRRLHRSLEALPDAPAQSVDVPEEVRAGYLHTIRHLTDLTHGHFSERHPDVPNTVIGDDARRRILEAAENEVFSPGDLIWVEWDTKKERIVSLGWHYYYRWAYADTVRRKEWKLERRGLFPLPEEKQLDGDEEEKHRPPHKLSAIRRLFGYTGDNEGSEGIGKGDHEQLMGRIFVNAAVEVIENGDTEENRFLPPTFLRELGMPRPSAVEHYLRQPYHPNSRPSDRATLVTYGDAAGYDASGELAGRKFYLDRSDAYGGEPWKDDSEANRLNERSTLAIDASKPGRRFRFVVRFRDIDPDELAALLLALCPHQFREHIGGEHPDGYCSKLGYARPLGWGTVRIEAKELLFLQQVFDGPKLKQECDIMKRVKQRFRKPPMLEDWLAVHRHKNPEAGDYPKEDGQIYKYHAHLRGKHTRLRRYEKE